MNWFDRYITNNDSVFIIISSSSVDTESLDHCLTELINVSIRNIELSGGTKYSENIFKILKSYKKKYSLNFLIHNYFPPSKKDFVLNIASNSKATRLKSINFIKKSINLAHDLQIDCYTLHAGYTRELHVAQKSDDFIAGSNRGISPELASDNMLKSLSEIRDYAFKRRVKIDLENLFPDNDAPDSSLLCTPSDIIPFLNYYRNDESVGFLLDLGHLFLSANYFGFDKDDFIGTLRKDFQHKILEIHLSGNDGKEDQYALLSPDCWQLEAAKKFDLAKTPVTIECREFNTEEILKQYQMVQNILEG